MTEIIEQLSEELTQAEDAYAAALTQAAQGVAPARTPPVVVDKPQEVLFDKSAEQTYVLEFTDDDGAYQVTHRYGPLPDSALIAFDEGRDVIMRTVGKDATEVQTRSGAAACALFDTLIISVKGYGEPGAAPPDDWRELIDADEKQAGVNALLACEVISDAPKNGVARRWGRRSGRTFRLRCYFNGAEIIVTHRLRAKTAADQAAFDQLRGGVRLTKGQKMGASDIHLPPTWAGKGELYRAIMEQTEGYAGRVPLHHAAAIIDAYFAETGTLAEKK